MSNPYSLIDAAESGSYLEVDVLLWEKTYDINLQNEDGISALLAASNRNNVEIAACLLKHGADVNCADKDGWTPLSIAAINGYEALAEVLINHGANVNYKGPVIMPPLTLASRNGHQKIERLLILKGANPTNVPGDYLCDAARKIWQYSGEDPVLIALQAGFKAGQPDLTLIEEYTPKDPRDMVTFQAVESLIR